MRCKVGDLAVVVSDPHFDGVDVGKFVIVRSWDAKYQEWDCESLSGLFRCNGGTTLEPGICDDWLRPIRDQPGQDETLTWKSLPSPVKVSPAMMDSLK